MLVGFICIVTAMGFNIALNRVGVMSLIQFSLKFNECHIQYYVCHTTTDGTYIPKWYFRNCSMLRNGGLGYKSAEGMGVEGLFWYKYINFMHF